MAGQRAARRHRRALGALRLSADREHAALDPAGQLLGLLALAALTFGLIESRDNGCGSWGTLVPLGIAVLSGAWFAVTERRLARPMLPLALFADRRFTIPNVASFVLGFGTSAVFVLLSLFLQDVQHRSPLAAGLLFLPLSVVICLTGPAGARLCARFGPSPVMVAGYAVSGAGLLGLLALGARSGAVALTVFEVVLGAGMGASIASTQLAGVLALPRERSGLASACIATTRQGGTALGVAVLGLIVATAAGTPASPGYSGGFVRGLHLAGVVAGALTLATAALLAAAAAKRPSPAGASKAQAPATPAPPSRLPRPSSWPAPGTTDVLAAAGSMLTAWQLTGRPARWTWTQAVKVPVQYGSSSGN